jgi:hypothetical protein
VSARSGRGADIPERETKHNAGDEDIGAFELDWREPSTRTIERRWREAIYDCNYVPRGSNSSRRGFGRFATVIFDNWDDSKPALVLDTEDDCASLSAPNCFISALGESLIHGDPRWITLLLSFHSRIGSENPQCRDEAGMRPAMVKS